MPPHSDRPQRSRNGLAGRALQRMLARGEGDPDLLGSEGSFAPPIGSRWRGPEGPVGYFIDFSAKIEAPSWPPPWLEPRSEQLHVATAQWGLGAYERYLAGEGSGYLQAAVDAAEHLLRLQEVRGARRGAWLHLKPMPHTFALDPPWLSAMAQGEGASLLARIFYETGDARFAEAARVALEPMSVPVSSGGVLAELEGDPFLEEYPTHPPSFVLNGAIFAIWGYLDVGRLLGESEATARFEELAAALVRNISRYDTGSWSRYDLYPHRLINVASPAYHLLHVNQLRVLSEQYPHPEVNRVRQAFESYRSSRRLRRRALARKIAFRLAVPRNRLLAGRGARRRRRRTRPGTRDDVLVLCYHALSENWDADLSITPAAFEQQLGILVERGYRGVRFSEAAGGKAAGRAVAITFDDAYRSVYELARPILERFGMPATVFVPTAFAGGDEPMAWEGIDHWLHTPHRDELRPARWEELRELCNAGWEIGSHTATHPRLTELGADDLARELRESRLACEERLGAPCDSIAYPYGATDTRVAAVAADAGYRFGAALPIDRWRDPGPLNWPRIGVYHTDDRAVFERKISARMRRLRSSRAWPLLAPAWRRLKHGSR